jgi:hypothetical protein
LVAVVGALVAYTVRVEAGLTGAPPLAAAYDAILDARFDRAEQALKDACPPAPVGACAALRAVSASWEILLNPESTALDARFANLAAAAIAQNEAWTGREPQRAEAWFYLAGAYAPRAQWRVLRGERLAAAFDGKKIKDALEHALQLDGTLYDAYFGIGLYHYYADVAPTAAKALRWLLFLPGGNRVKGMQEMLQARDRGELLKGEADYQIQVVELWYEQNTAGALRRLESLDARYPHNPLFRQRIAEAREIYLHDHSGSAAAWQELLARARAGSVQAPRATEIRARLGLASMYASMNRVHDAIDEWNRVIEMRPTEPVGALARAQRELRAASAQRGRQ